MPKAKVNGVELNYEVHSDGYPLVLAHGFTASLNMRDDKYRHWPRNTGWPPLTPGVPGTCRTGGKRR
jgi:pimeloyl-ACP methyl ester carboxylesterase